MKVTNPINLSRYQQLLNTPEWKEFSARIKRTRNFCFYCHRSDVALEVHHPFYDRDRKPWEYHDDEVITCCRACHREMEDQLKKFRTYVFRHMHPKAFRVLNGAMAVAVKEYDPLMFCHALAEFVSNRSLIESHAKAWSNPVPASPEVVKNALAKLAKEL